MIFSNQKVAIGMLALGSAFAAAGVVGCASVAENGREAYAEESGSVVLPLQTTGPSGAVYHLQDAVFVIKDAKGQAVTALSTAADPDAEVLSAKVNRGHYTIELRGDWTLLRTNEGKSAIVPARLSGPSSIAVFVARNVDVVVPFVFATDKEPVTFEQGSLGVRISVEETATCGNGRVEAGEVCDDGAFTGRPNHCDTECQFQCAGACPLRVNPESTETGDGSTWSEPLTSVQAAIDLQSSLGGGQVWLRGPGPFDALTANGVQPLITLRPFVFLFGGFSGSERRLEDRGFDARTVISSAGDVHDPIAPIIVGASSSSMESFTILNPSTTALFLKNAHSFLVTNVDIEGGALTGSASHVSVVDSSGTFQQISVRNGWTIDGVAGLRCEGSSVRVWASEFRGMHTVEGSTGIGTVSSTLVFDDVRFIGNRPGGLGVGSGLHVVDSHVLATRGLWLRNLGTTTVSVRRSKLLAVDSHWESNRSDGPILFVSDGSSTQLLNSSLVDNGSAGSGAILTAGELDMVNVTFFDNRGSDSSTAIADDVYILSPGACATIQNVFTNAGARSIAGGYVGGGNCILGPDALAYVRDDLGYREVFMTPALGCADLGDDEAAREAAERAVQFAHELDSEISFPPPAHWWRDLTSIYPLCMDDDPVDPGRHYDPAECRNPPRTTDDVRR
jgi:hypothetical protein